MSDERSGMRVIIPLPPECFRLVLHPEANATITRQFRSA
jgi:hypothetical protein